MVVVTLALYTEGPTDGDTDKGFDFLPQIIRRTTESILLQYGQSSSEIDVLLPYFRCNKPTGVTAHDQCILYVAREIAGYHALIIHSDSDDRGYKQTIVERFQPGKDLVLAAKNMREEICTDLVPIIPVRMTEAWMLADPEALRIVLGTQMEASTLGAPLKAKLVEGELEPKAKLKSVIKTAYPGQPSKIYNRFRAKLFQELGSQISLQRLGEVPSYQFFVRDLAAILQVLNFIRK